LHRLRAFFRSIDGGDFIALDNSRAYDQSEGHEDLTEEAAKRGVGHYSGVFWHQQSAERAFHNKRFIRPLNLHWVGDHAAVAQRLAGLGSPYVVRSLGADGAFVVEPGEPVLICFPDPQDAEALAEPLRLLDGKADTPEQRAWLVSVAGQGAPDQAVRALHDVLSGAPGANVPGDVMAIRPAVLARAEELATAHDGEYARDVLELVGVGDRDAHLTLLRALSKRRGWRIRTELVGAWRAVALGDDAAEAKEALKPLKKWAAAKPGRYDSSAAVIGAPFAYAEALAASRGDEVNSLLDELVADEKLPMLSRLDLLEDIAVRRSHAEVEPNGLTFPLGYALVAADESLAPFTGGLALTKPAHQHFWFEELDAPAAALRERIRGMFLSVADGGAVTFRDEAQASSEDPVDVELYRAAGRMSRR